MSTFSIQYLEAGPHIADLPPQVAAARLRAAFERLPLAMVLIGWQLPDATLQACAEVCEQAGATLYRWQPLLTGDGIFTPRPEWQVIGLNGQPVAGFQQMPEFTFVCPNRPAAANAALDNLDRALTNAPYRGVFLDRIRWPSPAADPGAQFGCFCPDCQRAAAEQDLDLDAARQLLLELLDTPDGPARIARLLLDAACSAGDALTPLGALMQFRVWSITRFVGRAIQVARAHGLAVGLDGFSPALTPMVGQGLGALDAGADWTKVMTYGHTLAPAGVPFELAALADWLAARGGLSGDDALRLITQTTGLPLPDTLRALRGEGLSPEALGDEVRRARASGVRTLLAGIELVDIEGITALSDAQIRADVAAFRDHGADGLALSWDLWAIPLGRLDVVLDAWGA